MPGSSLAKDRWQGTGGWKKTVTSKTADKSKIKQLLVAAVLFLPLSFFIWFYSAALLVLPVHWLAEWILVHWQPDLFKEITQNYYLLNAQTLIFPDQEFAQGAGKLAVLEVTANPMLYGYGLAVFAGLVMARPDLSWKQRLKQLLIGYVVVVLIQTWGVIWDILKSLFFSGGPDAQQAVLNIGIDPNLIALFYQTGYLIFPAVIPVMVWIVLNRDFITELTGLGLDSSLVAGNARRRKGTSGKADGS